MHQNIRQIMTISSRTWLLSVKIETAKRHQGEFKRRESFVAIRMGRSTLDKFQIFELFRILNLFLILLDVLGRVPASLQKPSMSLKLDIGKV